MQVNEPRTPSGGWVTLHADQRTKDQRQADEEMREAIEVDGEDISLDISETIQFVEWIEETDVVDVELVDFDTEVDTSAVLSDCVRRLEQSAATDTGVFAYDIDEIPEDAETLIQRALRSLK